MQFYPALHFASIFFKAPFIRFLWLQRLMQPSSFDRLSTTEWVLGGKVADVALSRLCAGDEVNCIRLIQLSSWLSWLRTVCCMEHNSYLECFCFVSVPKRLQCGGALMRSACLSLTCISDCDEPSSRLRLSRCIHLRRGCFSEEINIESLKLT